MELSKTRGKKYLKDKRWYVNYHFCFIDVHAAFCYMSQIVKGIL